MEAESLMLAIIDGIMFVIEIADGVFHLVEGALWCGEKLGELWRRFRG